MSESPQWIAVINFRSGARYAVGWGSSRQEALEHARRMHHPRVPYSIEHAERSRDGSAVMTSGILRDFVPKPFNPTHADIERALPVLEELEARTGLTVPIDEWPKLPTWACGRSRHIFDAEPVTEIIGVGDSPFAAELMAYEALKIEASKWPSGMILFEMTLEESLTAMIFSIGGEGSVLLRRSV